jgi:signal peptidase I
MAKNAGFIFAIIAWLVSCFSIKASLPPDTHCITTRALTRVEGNSLAGWINANTILQVWYGYYQCNLPQKDEFVIFKHGLSKLPLIKKVCAAPGDSFALLSYHRGACLWVNGDTVRGASGFPLFISDKRIPVLSYYEKTYSGVIPSNACLVIGSQSNTHDSTLFGPVGIASLQGRAIKVED